MLDRSDAEPPLFVASAPCAHALFDASLVRMAAFHLVAHQASWPDQLPSVTARLEQIGYPVLFTPVPYIFTGRDMILSLAPAGQLKTIPAEIIHLRFGLVSAARVLKGAVNVFVSADASPSAVEPPPVGPLLGERTLPDAFTHVLHGGNAPQLERRGGGPLQTVDASGLLA